jgi:3-hydroxyacyl-CoA dehydrogenase / enoyl-CoA hydratase / 3-hydroxybutyryl-CoA epimerase
VSPALRLEIAGSRGVLTFDASDRPVNTFDSEVIQELEALLDTLESRRDLEGLRVESAKPGNFLAGADLEELGRIESAAQAALWLRRAQTALRRLERLPYPTVALLGGAALGGGLELALACTYRVAAEDRSVELGLPEIQLGLCPAAGGTWRLPRQVGFRRGLELLLSGRRVRPAEARALGLIDEVVPRAALAAAGERLLRERPRPRRGGALGERLLFGQPLGRALAVALARRAVARRTGRRLPAPYAILAAARAGGALGGRAAEGVERREFGPLALSPESRALVGLFFATRAARPRAAAPGPSPRVGVVGAGLMGSGIAQVAARRGHAVRLVDLDGTALGRALAKAEHAWDESLRRHRMTPAERRAARAHLQPAGDLAALGFCDVVVEAIVEDLEAKRALFTELAAQLDERTLLASNTSTLPIASLAEGSPAPERVLGLHFFSPVERMPLVEIVRHPGASDDTIARARSFVAALGKTGIVVADGPGFYTTRVIGAWTAQAAAMVEEGVAPRAVELAGRRAGFPVGPLALLDEVGLDVAARAARTLHTAFRERFPAPEALDARVAEGRLGRKSGRGFYLYAERGKRLIGAGTPLAAAAGERLALRLRHALAVEAVRCLEEGILGSATDGDLGAVLGLGFPPETGGPFRWLDAVGAAAAVTTLDELAQAHGAQFDPPSLLRDLARRGARFHRAD